MAPLGQCSNSCRRRRRPNTSRKSRQTLKRKAISTLNRPLSIGSLTGSLTAVGCGIRAPAHVTTEARLSIERADRVYSLVADPLAEAWIAQRNPTAISLAGLYAEDKLRAQTYAEMTDTIVTAVESGLRVCAVAYGHPGLYAMPLHDAIRRVRAGGREAEMLPGISAQDCLIAELGLDPAQTGTCSFEATDFLLYDRTIDRSTTIILWQIGVIGEQTFRADVSSANRAGIETLAERLAVDYAAEHAVIVFQAARLVTSPSTIVRTTIGALVQAPIGPLSTLVIPPSEKPRVNRAVYRRLLTTHQ